MAVPSGNVMHTPEEYYAVGVPISNELNVISGPKAVLDG
jgi:hypothetical protein